MKQIYFKERKASFFQNKKFLTVLMGLFIISLMVFSVLYYGLDSSGTQKVEYNGVRFVQTNLGWLGYTESEQKILLLSNPSELANVTIGASFSFLTSLSRLYVSFSPEDDVSSALQDFQQNVVFSGYLMAACSEEHEACSNLPLKTCADATASIGVVLFVQAEEDSIILEGNCLTIQGKNLLILTDKLILDSYV